MGRLVDAAVEAIGVQAASLTARDIAADGRINTDPITFRSRFALRLDKGHGEDEKTVHRAGLGPQGLQLALLAIRACNNLQSARRAWTSICTRTPSCTGTFRTTQSTSSSAKGGSTGSRITPCAGTWPPH